MNIAFPYFPPRPSGGPYTRQFLARYERTHLVQKKLNGDRVDLLMENGNLRFANRHGSLYKFAVKTNMLAHAPAGKCLFDGEVDNALAAQLGTAGNYFPFEAVVFDGKDLSHECPSVRVAVAKDFCRKAGIPWVYDVDEAYLAKGKANLPRWEGVVLKKLGSAYLPLPSDAAHTPSWTKLKW